MFYQQNLSRYSFHYQIIELSYRHFPELKTFGKRMGTKGVLGMKRNVLYENKWVFILISLFQYVSKTYYPKIFIYNLETFSGNRFPPY